MKLEPPDSHHLRAAVGWMELGNPTEAGEELARISEANVEHPAVLEVRWELCASTRSWEAAFAVAEALVRVAPELSSGWVHRAYAMRRMRHGGLQLAWSLLLPAADMFPKEDIIPYNLACYAAQQARPDAAWEWLQRAIKVAGDLKLIRDRALLDADLQPLWERIRKLK